MGILSSVKSVADLASTRSLIEAWLVFIERTFFIWWFVVSAIKL